jgi:hypothetical protein
LAAEVRSPVSNGWLPAAICWLLAAGCCLSATICRLPFAICGLQDTVSKPICFVYGLLAAA